MMLLDALFEMGGAFVPNFSDRTFPQFFAEELNIDIDAAIFARHGPLHYAGPLCRAVMLGQTGGQY